MNWPYEHGTQPEKLAANFETVVRSFEGPLLRFLRGYVAREAVVAELAQDVFVKAYNQLVRYDPSRPFSAWFFTIAANHARDHLRHERTHHSDPIEESVFEHSQPAYLTPDRQLVSAELSAALDAAIQNLHPTYKEPLLLRHSSGLSVKEISEVLGISADTVKTRLSRARRQLQETLAPDWSPR